MGLLFIFFRDVVPYAEKLSVCARCVAGDRVPDPSRRQVRVKNGHSLSVMSHGKCARPHTLATTVKNRVSGQKMGRRRRYERYKRRGTIKPAA